jgi:hypothetical protein
MKVVSLVSMFFFAVFISACGSGESGSSNDSSQTPAAPPISIPPDPYNLDRSPDIAGPDQDGDRVRDDIAAAIQSFQLTEDKRRALMDVAQALRRAITQSGTKSEAYTNALELQRTIGCMASLDPDNFARLVNTIEAITANTEARTYAYIRFHELLGPSIFPDIIQPICRVGVS